MTLLLPEGSWWDWEVVEWSGGSLRLAACHDLTYYHLLELRFHEVDYVACPAVFHDPVFREPTDDERNLVFRALGELPKLLVAFDADPNAGVGPVPCLIAADRVEIVEGPVPRYRPDNSAQGTDRPMTADHPDHKAP